VSKNTLGSEYNLNNQAIGQQQVQGENRRNSAIDAARRLYNELLMGGKQRFGGASSAGEAYQSLAGTELQRNNQSIATDYSTFMGQVDMARNSLTERYNQSLQQLELQKQQLLSQAQRDFQDRLLEIDRMKAEAGQNKANARLEALQSLRNQAYQIQLSTAQNQSQLNTAKAQAEQELQNAISSMGANVQQANTAGQTLAQNVPSQYQTGLALGPTQQSAAQQYTGAINPRRQEQLYA
jgi:hypothetical protein